MEKIYKKKVFTHHLFSSCLKNAIVVFLCLISYQSFSQEKVITGVVKDQSGVTLPGVSVMIKNTNIGTVTNENGVYTLKLPNGQSTLVFKYLGFDSFELPVSTGTNFNVTLKESENSLEEVVVVGYGTQKKSTLTGSVATISSKEILKSPIANVTNALVGRLPGVTAVQRSGAPGANSAILNIRGAATYGNTSAIVIVDGIERATFGDIDPGEIETISVLKDASSTAIYGIRGANGVIIVTTKGGKEGKPRVSYTSNLSLQSYTGIPKALNSYDNARLINEAYRNDGLPEPWSADALQKFKDGSDPLAYPDINWFDYVTRKSYPQQNHNINVSGGTKLIKYFTSVGYLHEDGIFKKFDSPYGINTTPNYNRYNFRSNLDLNLTDRFQVSVRLGGRFQRRYQPAGLNSGFPYDNLEGMISRIVQTPSFAYPVTLPGGLIAEDPSVGQNLWNPYAVLTRWGTRQDDNNALESAFNVNYKLDQLTKGLSFKGVFAFDSYFTSITRRNANWASYKINRITGEITPSGDAQRIANVPLSGLIVENGGNINTNLQLGFNYERSFGNHNLTGLILATRQFNQIKGSGLDASPFATQGVVSRFTYNFKSKYYAEFNAAYNGSENFSPNKRYGFFPAVSAGWTLSNEPFLQTVKFIDYLKIRGSYGLVGNDKVGNGRFLYINDYATSGSIQFGNPSSLVNYNLVKQTKFGNSDVTWETGLKRNIGFESRFFKDLIELNVDLFDETRKDILTARQSGLVTYGQSYPVLNIGEVYNKGYEIELNFRRRVGQFDLGLNNQLSFARNKIINRDEPAGNLEYQKQQGKPIGQFFGYLNDGFYTPQDIANYVPNSNTLGTPIAGDLKYKDYNGDGKISIDDQVAIGYTRTPEYTYSFSPSVGYKGFSLSVLFQGVAHVSSDLILSEANQGMQMYEFQLNRWTPETAATATWPALHPRGNGYISYKLNDFILQDASYLKIRNAEFAWTLPQKWVNKIKLSSARITLSGQNLYTWTPFKMYVDPENVNLDFGIFSKQSIYPTARIYNLGLNLQF
ncbi:TonB-dependent receptor [Pelobium sp.]|nr:TonB-dependent receptor [Pelobium sp.]MDA9555564.1 TonB-dependent receptor [Pelobium sp.]